MILDNGGELRMRDLMLHFARGRQKVANVATQGALAIRENP